MDLKKLLGLMLPIILIIGCTNDAPTEPADAGNNDVQQNEDANETSDPAETESNDAAENEEDESESTTASTESKTTENSTSESAKEAYIQELEQTELELAPLKTQAQNGTQTERNQAMQEIFTQWDDVLNDIYGSLEEQLSEGDMESLREEQREWITHRDEAAEEEASKFEDGSLEPYEHANVMAQLTRERCYELVETYMHG
ncbi:lysozyme inhibitor LprI family protein [Lentibacillus sp. CBA3610]|uniref:lysozyme inhibitor LprI family protein n=1 Tax=Lentibacillus sp. CBA3610 TaxID=2518176 RepID=UPI001594F02C|nr:lysozyme inhibitor LprI family protein [Lentibacillus sp. CBA3610]QKY70758.1 DUF1311 domain-containing protein [Lentibacillus sp. CBA3610]